MCLIVVAWRQYPRYDLLLAANRDEYHARSTDAAHWWGQPHDFFGGRDRQAGGAWCGADRSGRFAAVTNVRDPQAPAGRRSRGALVADYFAIETTAAAWAERISVSGAAYSPFNLLVGDATGLYFVSNRDRRGVRLIRPGIIAISNGHWGEHWPKTQQAAAAMHRQLQADAVDDDALLALLSDTDSAADGALPDTGVGLARERFLSPMFIQSAVYGTRAATVLRRDSGHRTMRMVEQGFDPAGQGVHRVQDHWSIETCST